MCLCVACCRYVDIQQQEAGAGPASAGASGYGAAKQKRPSRRDPYALGKKANVQGFIRRMAITAEQLGVNLDDFPQHGASPLSRPYHLYGWLRRSRWLRRPAADRAIDHPARRGSPCL